MNTGNSASVLVSKAPSDFNVQMARFELESGEQSITVLRGTGSNFYCTCYASK